MQVLGILSQRVKSRWAINRAKGTPECRRDSQGDCWVGFTYITRCQWRWRWGGIKDELYQQQPNAKTIQQDCLRKKIFCVSCTADRLSFAPNADEEEMRRCWWCLMMLMMLMKHHEETTFQPPRQILAGVLPFCNPPKQEKSSYFLEKCFGLWEHLSYYSEQPPLYKSLDIPGWSWVRQLLRMRCEV